MTAYTANPAIELGLLFAELSSRRDDELAVLYPNAHAASRFVNPACSCHSAQDTVSSQSTFEQLESGLRSGLTVANQLGGGLHGYSFGIRKTGSAQQDAQVTDEAKQQQLTGQSAEEAVAGISRDTAGAQVAIAPIFDRE
ncbi:hypothetical protein LMG28688_06933 [Paraburkholderia caffeinitolerans]|uniref:Uncharacterized protein n=1 Tax=Paraburkholderia caffeinitolerans TaxID=1723730 RepID=A0A6J5H0N7_9BURK|nr:hypothetical protein [Paraburkholderia caffeinitolerans]CAB3809175.1 hypothetical protein LMG28688_06933 [Paraburkholderia caffeinitolerans]